MSDRELQEQIAAVLQGRLPWPTADACAVDIVQMFNRKGWTVAGSATTPHDHDEQLSHLIDEWGHLGTVMQVLRTLTDDQAKQLLDAARTHCEPTAGPATPTEPD
jgi:hypothetical protein